MRFFKRLIVEDIPFFKRQEFDFSQPGLSVITGLNLEGASSSTGEVPHTNATGKSLLLKQVLNIFFKAGATGTAQDRLSRGKVTLELDVGPNQFVISRFARGKKMRYSIMMNGRDVTPDRAPDAENYVLRVLGMSQDVFQMTYYLDHLRPHLLRTGNTTARKAFFTEFFRLTAEDDLAKVARRRKKQLSEDTALLLELQDQFSRLELSDVGPLLGLRDRFATRAAQWTEHVEALRSDREHVQFRERFARPLAFFMRAPRDNGQTSSDALDWAFARVKTAKARSNEVIRSYERFSAYRSERSAYEHAIKARAEYIEKRGITEEMLAPGYLPEIVALERKARVARDDAFEELANYRSRTSAAERNQQRLIEELSSAKEAIQKLDHAHSSDQGAVCPTCKQRTDEESYRAARATLIAKYREAQSLQSASVSHEEAEARVAELRAEYDRLTEKHRRIEARVNALHGVPDLPEEPRKPEGPVPEEAEVEAARETISKSERVNADLVELQMNATEEQLEDMWNGVERTYSNESFDEAVAAESAIQIKLASVEARLRAAESAQHNYDQLKARIEELKEATKDADAIDLIYQAFVSSDGIKNMRISAICSVLEAQINKLSRHVFPSEYSFKFDLSTQFEIQVTRKVGDHLETTDVRELSGAEAGLFDLMTAVALQSFLPERLKSNVMILDEIDSNFGPAMSQSFVRFLPKMLAEVVPHVIVITPLQTDYGDEARYYTMVHKGGQSKLLSGKRSTIENRARSRGLMPSAPSSSAPAPAPTPAPSRRARK